MALIEMVMPKMGESIMEGTVLSWLKKIGERIEQDEAVLEVATDKVDTEVPATHAGWLKQILVEEGQIVAVGTAIAVIDTQAAQDNAASAILGSERQDNSDYMQAIEPPSHTPNQTPVLEQQSSGQEEDIKTQSSQVTSQAVFLMDQPQAGRFYSPLVLTIAREEKVSMSDLERIPGTGQEDRVTKKDILDFVSWRASHGSLPAAKAIENQQILENKNLINVGNAQQNSLQMIDKPILKTTTEPQTNDQVGLINNQKPVVDSLESITASLAQAVEDAKVFTPENTPVPAQVLGTNQATNAENADSKSDTHIPVQTPAQAPIDTEKAAQKPAFVASPKSFSGDHEIVEMDRMRKMIAQRMIDSVRISPHVTSFVEADVTGIVFWRNRNKNEFLQKEGDIITYTPFFLEAVAKAIKDYPMINVSVDNDKIIVKKEINIGMAVALPTGNLIVPVIRNADQLNLVGLTRKVNDLARRARENKLVADDLTGGTYTISNVGSFGNLMGTPIILQPQVGILALGAIQKKPSVVETPQGDSIAIRHKMFLSHSYDHRVVDGALGGMFVRRVADYLENFDTNRKI